MLETDRGASGGHESAPLTQKILAFTKLFWANRGNHNETTAQKFLPEFTFEELRDAGLAAIQHGAAGFTEAAFQKEIEELRPSLFDPNFEPMITAKSPRAGQDILQASANNFYSGVTLADLKNFTERYPLEFAAGESQRASGRTGLSRRHARSPHSAGSLRRVSGKSQFLPGEGRRSGRTRASARPSAT